MKKKQTRNAARLAKKAAAKKGNHSPKKKKPVEFFKRKPRAQRLPGMEDSGIQELENLASDLVDVRNTKKAVMEQEKNCGESLVAAMKRHNRITYSHGGITIDLTTSEKAKVVIKEDVDDTPADNEPVETVLGVGAEVVYAED